MYIKKEHVCFCNYNRTHDAMVKRFLTKPRGSLFTIKMTSVWQAYLLFVYTYICIVYLLLFYHKKSFNLRLYVTEINILK